MSYWGLTPFIVICLVAVGATAYGAYEAGHEWMIGVIFCLIVGIGGLTMMNGLITDSKTTQAVREEYRKQKAEEKARQEECDTARERTRAQLDRQRLELTSDKVSEIEKAVKRMGEQLNNLVDMAKTFGKLITAKKLFLPLFGLGLL